MFVSAVQRYPRDAAEMEQVLFPEGCPNHVFVERVQVRVASVPMCMPVHEWFQRNLHFPCQDGRLLDKQALELFLAVSRSVIRQPSTVTLHFPSKYTVLYLVPILESLIKQLEAAKTLVDKGWIWFYHAKKQ